MSGSTHGATSKRIREEKVLRRLGTASIRLDVLDFLPSSRCLDRQNVERLKRIFLGECGCLPAAVENRIPAVISQATLHQALATAGIGHEELLSDTTEHRRLEFPAGSRLVCLRGKHRAQAAKECSSSLSWDNRWVIDLFDEGAYLK